jgi:hypothetical protein
MLHLTLRLVSLDGKRGQMRIRYEICMDVGLTEQLVEHSSMALRRLSNPDIACWPISNLLTRMHAGSDSPMACRPTLLH